MIPYFYSFIFMNICHSKLVELTGELVKQMGGAVGKEYTRANNKSRDLKRTVTLLEKEVMELSRGRKEEVCAHKDGVGQFMAKEAEWKRERNMWKEEMEVMKEELKEKDVKIQRLEEEVLIINGNYGKEWHLLQVGVLFEHMREEQELRQEAVEKWKGLYLAIKTELDDLIQRTCQGELGCWGEAEVNNLHRKLKVKEERVAELRARLVMKKKETTHMEQEVDILRQSLRTMSNTKQGKTRHLSRSFYLGKS